MDAIFVLRDHINLKTFEMVCNIKSIKMLLLEMDNDLWYSD